MPKLSAIPKVFALYPSEDSTQPPLLAVVAASEAEANQHIRTLLVKVPPAIAFELGTIGVPLHYAKPEYRGEAQDELPLSGGEVSHAQP